MNSISKHSLDKFNFQEAKEHKLQAIKSALAPKLKSIGKISNSERCENCGSVLCFGLYRNKQTSETAKILKNANFCKHRFCAFCSWKKSRKLIAEMMNVLEQAKSQYGNLEFLFLTLTVKNCSLSDMKSEVNYLSKSFEKFRHSKPFKSAFLGFIRAIEFLGDNTKKGEAHPHFHILLSVKKDYFDGRNYLTQNKLSEMWKKALGVDYTPVINIKKVKPKNQNIDASLSGLFETLKYSIKPLEIAKMNINDFELLIDNSKFVRQYNTGGIFRDIKPDIVFDKYINLSDDVWEFLEYEFYNWAGLDYQKNKI